MCKKGTQGQVLDVYVLPWQSMICVEYKGDASMCPQVPIPRDCDHVSMGDPHVSEELAWHAPVFPHPHNEAAKPIGTNTGRIGREAPLSLRMEGAYALAG